MRNSDRVSYAEEEITKERRVSTRRNRREQGMERVRRLFVHLSWNNPFVHIA